MKIKSIVKIFRHGARTSSTIGRLEDKILSPDRRGLTCVGYSQFYKIGMDIRNKIENNFDSEFYEDFDSFLKKGKMKIVLSGKNRVLESAQALADGIICAHTDLDKNFEFRLEKKFVENLYECEKFGN
jgi:hypothetical protein